MFRNKFIISILLILLSGLFSCFGGDDSNNLSQEDAVTVFAASLLSTVEATKKTNPYDDGSQPLVDNDTITLSNGAVVAYNVNFTDLGGDVYQINSYTLTITLNNVYESFLDVTLNGTLNMSMSGRFPPTGGDPLTFNIDGNITASGSVNGKATWDMTVVDDGINSCYSGSFAGFDYDELSGGITCTPSSYQ